MFFRLLLESFRRQRRRKLLAGTAILLGTTAVTAMLALATTIGDRIHRELAVYGANLIVTPQASALAIKIGGVDLHPATGNAYLRESDLAKLRIIFWANNITGISPELTLSGNSALVNGKATPVVLTGLWFNHDLQGLHTGASQLHPWWKLFGSWPRLEPHGNFVPVVLGSRLAAQLGLQTGSSFALQTPVAGAQHFTPNDTFQVTGIVSTGDATDNQVLLPLAAAQSLNGTPGAVSRVEVAARTRPEDAFARRDPDSLPAKKREIWYCRPYANSIAYQIREAIPGANAVQLRQVEQTEGTVLARISGLMWLVSAAALLSAAFAVSAAMATAILERRAEIGLMRSLGAGRTAIAALFYTEGALLALVAGTGGYFAGSALAAVLGARIFSTPSAAAVVTATDTHLAFHAAAHLLLSAFNPVLLPIVLALALVVALAGSTPSIRSALRVNPSHVLRSDA